MDDTTTETKRCFRCGDTLPIAKFYPHPQMADGHLGKCIDCTKADATRHRNEHLEETREYDRTRSREPKAKARRAAYQKRNRKEFPGRWNARQQARRARMAGIISQMPCHFCGSEENLEMHHPDYSKPLRVYWLCRTCHRRLDAMLKL